VEFNVEAAKADGLSDEEIQKLIAAGPPSIRNEEITTEETGVTPTPVQAPPKTKPTFNVEAAKADGLSDEEIQKLIAAGPPKQPTFNVEAAKADGLSDEEIQKLIAAGPPKTQTQAPKEKKYAGFFESTFGALSDQVDMASVGASALLPGGETTNEAAERYLKESQTKPQRTKFSYAAIEKAWSTGGMEGLKETINQLPGGLGEALGAIGPSIAAGATGFAIAGPVGAVLALAAMSASPNMGGNVIEQATADLEAGRPLDVNTATALAALVPQVALDVIPFKFGALSKLVGLSKKLPAGELRKKIAEQGIIKAIGKDAASIIATEMPAEVLQEIITKAQAGVDPFSDEAIAEYKEVAAVVFLTGGLAPYSAIKSKRQAIKDIKLEEDPEIQEDKEPDIEDSRNKKINDIINDEKIKTQVIEEKKAAERINKTELNTVDKDLIKDLGLNPLSTAAKELEGKDLSNLDDLEMVDKILANENLNIKHNKKAVNNLKRIIKKNKIVLLETQQQEAQNALTRPRGSKPSPTGKSAGVSQLESEQSQPTPSGTQNLDGDSVVAGGGRTTTTTGPETRVDAPLTDQEKALKIEIARKYLPRIEEARKKLRPLEEAELAKVNGDQAATYKLMAKQEARRQKAFMEINDEGMAEFEASRGRTTTTTGPETRVDAPLIDNPKNPIIKNPKIGSKVRIGRINNGKPEVLKGVIQEDPKLGRVLVSEEQGGTRIIPLTNSQILNPTTNDVTQLDSLANRIKESKSKKQQLLDTKKEKEDTQESRVFDPKLLDIESRLAQAEFEVQSYLRQDNKVPPFVANRVRALRKEKTDYLNTQSTQESRADTEGTGQVYYRGTSEKFDNVAGTGGVIYFSPNREEAKIVGVVLSLHTALRLKTHLILITKPILKKYWLN
jgi:hypothetical protein